MWACREGLSLDRPRFQKLTLELLQKLSAPSDCLWIEEIAAMLMKCKEPKKESNNHTTKKRNTRTTSAIVDNDDQEVDKEAKKEEEADASAKKKIKRSPSTRN